MFDLIPAPYKIALVAAAVIAGGAYGFSLGHAWNADDLADCQRTLTQITEAQHALEKETDARHLVQQRQRADAEIAWAAALDHARARPRTVRVRQDCSSSGGLSATAAPAGLAAQPYVGQSGPGAQRDVAFEECEVRLNHAVVDAAWIEHAKAWADQQAGATR